MGKSIYIAEKPSVAREFAKALKLNAKNRDGYMESCLDHGMAPLTELYQGELIPSRAFADGGIHEAIMAYEDATFFEILAQELALRDMDDPPITPENYDEIMARMETYLGEFEQHGTDNITVDMEE